MKSCPFVAAELTGSEWLLASVGIITNGRHLPILNQSFYKMSITNVRHHTRFWSCSSRKPLVQ